MSHIRESAILIKNEIEAVVHQVEEKSRINKLPPMVFRLFGDVDYMQQLDEIPEKFKEKIIVLTTSDTLAETVNSIQRKGWEVCVAESVNDQTARENSSLLLNAAVQYLKEKGSAHAFFLSSGFQRHAGMYYSMLHKIMKRSPGMDAYYFILPETHEGVSLNCHLDIFNSSQDFLTHRFPYETALCMNLQSMPEFEMVWSKKGALGSMANGVKYGGMEFFITLLSKYTELKRKSVAWSPRMLGISLPIATRSEANISFLESTLEIPQGYSPSHTRSAEVTQSEIKLLRRQATFEAVMSHLGITDQDIRILFSNTNCVSGIADIALFEHQKSPLI